MAPKERGFNVPKTLRDSIKDALTTDRDYLLPHELSIAEEIASGKVIYREHIDWLQEFFSSIDVQYLLHGGDDARQWLNKVDSPASVVASGFSGRDEWIFFVTGPPASTTKTMFPAAINCSKLREKIIAASAIRCGSCSATSTITI